MNNIILKYLFKLYYIITIKFIVSILAPIVTSVQLMPQLYKTYTTKNAKGISFYSLLLILTTNTLWLLHSYFILDYSLIVSGIVGIIINMLVLILYIIYSK